MGVEERMDGPRDGLTRKFSALLRILRREGRSQCPNQARKTGGRWKGQRSSGLYLVSFQLSGFLHSFFPNLDFVVLHSQIWISSFFIPKSCHNCLQCLPLACACLNLFFLACIQTQASKRLYLRLRFGSLWSLTLMAWLVLKLLPSPS